MTSTLLFTTETTKIDLRLAALKLVYPLGAALRLNPNIAEAHNALGSIYSVEQKAISSLNEEIRLNPYIAFLHANLGSIYERLGSHDETIAEYKEELRINPDLTVVHNQLKKLEQKIEQARP